MGGTLGAGVVGTNTEEKIFFCVFKFICIPLVGVLVGAVVGRNDFEVLVGILTTTE